MNYWSRKDTKAWVEQLENRIDDIDYYLKKTIDWCDSYGIDNDQLIFLCSFLTCIWVSELRGEPITYNELMELLGVEDREIEEDKIYELEEKFLELEHDELLEKVVEMFNDIDFEDDEED
jgi:hypothetical protein